MKTNTLLETIRCEGGIPLHLSYHQHRLERSLKALGLKTHYSLSDLILPPNDGVYRCRFLYDALGYSVEYHPYSPKKISKLKLVDASGLDYSLKYSNRKTLDELFKKREGCDDILILQNGHITDTTIANIAFYLDHQWLTPNTPLLEGTTRARLLDEGRIKIATITLYDALNAPKIALMNAMMGCFEMENGIIT